MSQVTIPNKPHRVSLVSLLITLEGMAWKLLRALWKIFKALYLLGTKVQKWANRFFWVLVIADASGCGVAKVLLAVLTEVLESSHDLAVEFVHDSIDKIAEFISAYIPRLNVATCAPTGAQAAVVRFQKQLHRQVLSARRLAA